MHDLPLQERLLIRRLKKLRQRSLSGVYRDPRLLASYLVHNPAPTAARGDWPAGSPLRSEIDSALVDVKTYSRYVRRNAKADKRAYVEQADRLWAHVLTSVDRLIDAGERLEGNRIKPFH